MITKQTIFPLLIRFIGLALAIFGMYLTSLYNFLLFHTIVEILTIVLASGVFVVAWNSRHILDHHYLLFIGIGSLFVAGTTIPHMLTYKGMGIFPGYDANLPTQLWIVTLYLHSGTYFLAGWFIKRRVKVGYTLGAYLLITGLLLVSIFYWQIFPDCFIEGQGLTPFKVISEYLAILLFLAALPMLFKYRHKFEREVLILLVTATVFNLGAELAFTFYINVYGLSNLMGHLLRFVSMYLVYKAIVETGIVKPHQVLFRDLKQSEETLRRQAAELQARNEELDAFAHTVAHDLKSPLTYTISAVSILLEYDNLSAPERRETMEIIRQAGYKMNSIITELLLLAQMRHGHITIEPLDMVEIIEEVQNRLRYMFETEPVNLILPEIWPVALGYAPWVEEVWVNYISNAIKYGGHPPRVELGAAPQPDGTLCFWVQDNGDGLSPEEITQLFSPFSRLDQMRITGHGLGLSIVQRIVTQLGGQVGVQSTGRCGEGSKFYFTLPAAAPTQIAPAEHSRSLIFSA